MNEALLLSQATALINVILIDIVLAGDNAVVVGTAAAGLPAKQQRQVIFFGSALAFVARVVFALLVVQLLLFGPWLIIAGGLLLLWVAWKMWRDTHGGSAAHGVDGLGSGQVVTKTFASAVTQVAVADISMSLDNVLAVAGAARDHPYIMIFGLVLSIALMAVAAGYIAKLIDRYRWIAYVGIVVIVFVAGKMIWEGTHDMMTEAEPPAQAEPAVPPS